MIRETLLRENPHCFWCGKELPKYSKTKDGMATLEHIIPKKIGGGDFIRNIRLSCFGCNK